MSAPTRRSGGVPETRPELLVRLRRRDDEDAWRQFVDIYGPLIHRWSRRYGLQDADAADVTQAVLLAVASIIGEFRYDQDKGRFRSWLSTITRRQTMLAASRRRRLAVQAPERLDGLPARRSDAEDAWEAELSARRFRAASNRARPCFRARTWSAFWRSVVDGLRPEDVAHELGMTVGAVYIARCRVLARIRSLVDDSPA